MKYIWIIAFLFISILISCKQSSYDGEGTITYSISYLENNPYKSKFLPTKTELIFKGSNACFITSAGFGMFKLVNILNNKDKKYTSLLINNFGDNLAFTFNNDEYVQLETEPKFTFVETDETKMIAGLLCNKAIVNDLTKNKKFDIYYYKNIKMYYGASPYINFNYLLMEYQHTINNLPMKLYANKVNFSNVDTNLFKIRGDYNWVDSKRFYNYLNTFRIQ